MGMVLSGSGRRWVPDAAGEVALEAANSVAAGLALELIAREVGGGLGVQAALGAARRCSVQSSWRSPPRSRRWSWVPPEDAGIGAEPAVRASLGSLAKRAMRAISPSSLAAVRTPQPRSASSRGARVLTSAASSAWRWLMVRVSSRTRRSSSRTIRTRAGLLGAGSGEPRHASARRWWLARVAGSPSRARGRARASSAPCAARPTVRGDRPAAGSSAPRRVQRSWPSLWARPTCHRATRTGPSTARRRTPRC